MTIEQFIPNVRLIAFDFDGVFTDNTVYIAEDGTESVRVWRGDSVGMRKLDRLAIACVIISSETSPVIRAHSRRLGVHCIQGVDDKRTLLEDYAKELGMTMEQVAFVGNDIHDAPCLTAVGLPIVVQDAHPDVLPYARYRTKARGGYGAVREVCDLFERVLIQRQ
jgi:YrbI family 3-deoxy-D-manno-octulosonate 8-phosphate phosphatase